MSNQPDRFALFILGPKEKRVEIVEDTHIANAATVVLNKEDHTMGNMLRHAVMAIPGVLFAGYRVPHPLEPRTVLKIQTDGTITPVQALKSGCENVISHIGQVRASFKAQAQQFDDQGHSAMMMGNGGVGLGAASTGAGLQSSYGNAYGSAEYGYGADLGQRDDDTAGYVDI